MHAYVLLMISRACIPLLSGFDVHQDTEDYDFIEYTVVVKLTPGALGGPRGS